MHAPQNPWACVTPEEEKATQQRQMRPAGAGSPRPTSPGGTLCSQPSICQAGKCRGCQAQLGEASWTCDGQSAGITVDQTARRQKTSGGTDKPLLGRCWAETRSSLQLRHLNQHAPETLSRARKPAGTARVSI
ncbi:SITS-binding protein-like [Platysternon megacephalum]|uniref:SITS-binding protein-like n=1 Tax=Platysternon megacephalum TaxID=55544 RepID=A0A4D9DLV6_9SAUR|nr:SITS-binding protein-like [Platysternon megacephalum]